MYIASLGTTSIPGHHEGSRKPTTKLPFCVLICMIPLASGSDGMICAIASHSVFIRCVTTAVLANVYYDMYNESKSRTIYCCVQAVCAPFVATSASFLRVCRRARTFDRRSAAITLFCSAFLSTNSWPTSMNWMLARPSRSRTCICSGLAAGCRVARCLIPRSRTASSNSGTTGD